MRRRRESRDSGNPEDSERRTKLEEELRRRVAERKRQERGGKVSEDEAFWGRLRSVQVSLLFLRDLRVPLWGVGDSFVLFGGRVRTPTWFVGSVLAFTRVF